MHDGVKVKLSGKEYIIPPLNLKSIRMLEDHIAAMSRIKEDQALSAEMVGHMSSLVHTAMVRNYPDLTQDDVEEMLDVTNVRMVIKAIMGASGFVLPGELEPVGVMANPSIGTPSTDT